MQCKIYKKEDRTIKQWSGGTTCQLAIYPQDGKYEGRDFIWRLSTATVEAEESDFTDLPDYNRVLMVLKGEVILEHKEIRTAKLNTYEYDYFDGAYSTKSYGIITDYNLMTRKDHVGKLEKIDLTENYRQLPTKKKAVSRGFFVAKGYAVVSINGESHVLQEEQQMVLYDEEAAPEIGIMGQGVLVYTCVTGKNAADSDTGDFSELETGEEYYKAEDISFREDLKAAAKIALTDFRGSKFIVKSLRNEWYDEELYDAIYKMEKLCLPLLVYLMGIVLIGYSYTRHSGITIAIAAVIIWTLMSILVISPFIYYLALPKPIKSHIKLREEMTEEEKGIELARQQENRRLEKILNRYENSGRRDTFGYEKKRPAKKKPKK